MSESTWVVKYLGPQGPTLSVIINGETVFEATAPSGDAVQFATRVVDAILMALGPQQTGLSEAKAGSTDNNGGDDERGATVAEIEDGDLFE